MNTKRDNLIEKLDAIYERFDEEQITIELSGDVLSRDVASDLEQVRKLEQRWKLTGKYKIVTTISPEEAAELEGMNEEDQDELVDEDFSYILPVGKKEPQFALTYLVLIPDKEEK